MSTSSAFAAISANLNTSLRPGSIKRTRADEATDAGAMTAVDRLHRAVTDTIVAQLEADPRPWSCPWHRDGGGLPKNALTHQSYRGINILSLWIAERGQGFASGRWATYRQWQALGAQVRKGAKGTAILFYKDLPRLRDAAAEGPRFVARASSVFNAAQVDGAPDEAAPHHSDEVALTSDLDGFAAQTGALIREGATACYRPGLDEIQMPARHRFISADGYGAILSHELVHWTGHPSRLDPASQPRQLHRSLAAAAPGRPPGPRHRRWPRLACCRSSHGAAVAVQGVDHDPCRPRCHALTAAKADPRPVPSSTVGPTLTRRTLLHLLGAPFLTHAAAATPEPDDVHLRLWRQLDTALHRRDHAIVNRDRLEATLVQQLGHPRVQLPTEPGTPPHFAADAFTIDRILGPGRHRLRQRLKVHLQRRLHIWHQAAHAAGLPQALTAEDAAFHTVEQATVALLDTPATTLVAIRLKLVVLLAKHAPSAADRNDAPWADLRRLLVDVDRVLASQSNLCLGTARGCIKTPASDIPQRSMRS